MTRRVRLDLAYDGTDFAGWAVQPARRTVQGVVEAALERLVRAPAPLTVAGRTDAGVHAAGQVAHVDLDDDVELDRLGPRLNRALPADVRVLAVGAAPAGFDARFAATARVYRYRVTDGVPDPLRRHDTLAHPRPLDTGRMAAAAAGLIGEHDFAAYCRRREGASTVRTLLRLEATRSGPLVCIEAEADAFCHQQVRSLVGALLAVGDARRGVQFPVELLRGGTRDGAPVAPAHGLCLLAVRYPPDAQLAERAQQARARRGPPAQAAL